MTTRGEFRATYTDAVTGDVKPAWQFVVENTDPRYVAFELDVLWATDGVADPVALLNRYASRIKMLHIKDGISVADPANATPVPVGQGEMDFRPILEAARRRVDYYFYEQDPPFGGSGVRSVRQRSGGVHLPRLLPVLSRTQENPGPALMAPVRRSSAGTPL